MKAGDLIFWHGRNTIALVVSVESETNWCHENLWVALLEEGIIINDDLAEGYTIIDKNWNWPDWHVHYGAVYESR